MPRILNLSDFFPLEPIYLVSLSPVFPKTLKFSRGLIRLKWNIFTGVSQSGNFLSFVYTYEKAFFCFFPYQLPFCTTTDQDIFTYSKYYNQLELLFFLDI